MLYAVLLAVQYVCVHVTVEKAALQLYYIGRHWKMGKEGGRKNEIGFPIPNKKYILRSTVLLHILARHIAC